MSAFPSTLKSLYRELTVALIALISFVAIVVGVLDYVYAVHRQTAQFERVVAQYETDLPQLLELPLWNVDDALAEKIGGAVLTNKDLAFVTIRDEAQRVIYQAGESGGDVVKRNIAVKHAGQIIGTVEIGLDLRSYQEESRRLIVSSIGVAALLITGLFGVMRWVLSNRLKKPVDALIGSLNEVVAGQYQQGKSPDTYEEFFPIMTSIHAMSAVVANREERLRKQAEELELYFTSALDLLCIADLDGRFYKLNPEWEKTLGYPVSELLGRQFLELVHPDDREATLQAMSLLSEKTPVLNYTNRYRHKDGSYRWIEWRAYPVGTLIYASARDITERLEAESALQTFQDQIRQMQKMEALGQLAGGIAHDFNNILTAMIGNAELATGKLAADHPSRPNLARILEAGDRASRLVQQILVFTHQQEFSRTLIPLAPIVEEAFALLRSTIPAGIELTYTCDAATPSVLADGTQIHQILMNLCTNAWHALGGNAGSITVDLAPVILHQPLFALYGDLPPGLYARLSVRDTGCGMDAETVKRIFDPFFTTKPVGLGTGLGLSVVLGIIQVHDGAIVVNSEPGRGTVFQLYFPAADEPVPARELTSSPPSGRQEGHGHLLYLDDEEMLVELVCDKLESLGYRVSGYTKAGEALNAIHADPGRFDMVVTDYNMPGLSGLDVARAIAGIRADLPVVLVSGYLSPADQVVIRASGIKEILSKPILLQQLGDVVARLLGSASSK